MISPILFLAFLLGGLHLNYEFKRVDLYKQSYSQLTEEGKQSLALLKVKKGVIEVTAARSEIEYILSKENLLDEEKKSLTRAVEDYFNPSSSPSGGSNAIIMMGGVPLVM